MRALDHYIQLFNADSTDFLLILVKVESINIIACFTVRKLESQTHKYVFVFLFKSIKNLFVCLLLLVLLCIRTTYLY